MEGTATWLQWVEHLAKLSVDAVVWSMVLFTGVRLIAYRMSNRLGHFLNDLMDALVYAGILVYLVIRPFVAQPFYIPSESMVPTLQVGDLVMVGKFNYRLGKPKPGDVIVFRAPDHALNPGQTPGNTDFIKRFIGAPGDVIEIKEGQGVYRNGQLLREPYVSAPPPYNAKVVDGTLYAYKESGEVWEAGNGHLHRFIEDANLRWRILQAKPEPIPPGKYLVLGDNRPHSSDSHEWGLLEEWRVVGKALFVFWPPTRIGIIR